MNCFKPLLIIFCACSRILSANIPTWSFESSQEGWNTQTLAELYFHNSETQREWAWELLGKFRFNGNEKVLDFGCGDGKITAQIARMVDEGKVTGIDISSEMISLAKRKFNSVAYPNLEYRQIDEMSFAHSSELSCDLVCSFTVFHLIGDPLKTLKNLKQCLKPHGKLLMMIPTGANQALSQATFETFTKYQIDLPWGKQKSENAFSMSTLEGCSHYLNEAGFEIISLKLVDTENGFYNLEECIKWMLAAGSANWKIPLEKSYAFFSDIANRYHELDPSLVDENGAVHFKMPKIHILAQPK